MSHMDYACGEDYIFTFLRSQRNRSFGCDVRRDCDAHGLLLSNHRNSRGRSSRRMKVCRQPR